MKSDQEFFIERMYKFFKSTLAESMTKDDLDIIIHLMSYVLGDIDFEATRMKSYVAIDLTPTDRIQQLSTNVAFPWSNALTPEQQRQYVKLYHLIRRRRGTVWAIENLCKVFGQDTASYYQASDLRSVKLLEYPYNYTGDAPCDTLKDENGKPILDENDCTIPDKSKPLKWCYYQSGAPKFPGDMVLRIPHMTTILYNEIVNTKLAGTRLYFLFYFMQGIFHCAPSTTGLSNRKFFFDPAYGKDYWKISDLQAPAWDKTPTSIIMYMEDYQVGHYVDNYEVTASQMFKVKTVKPFDKGWIFHEVNTPNYRGYIISSEQIVDDEVLYN